MKKTKRIQKIKKVKKIILQVSEVAEYLWQRGWAERNAGNISVNINDLIDDTMELDLEEHNHFKLEKSFPALANMVFFVTGTGKRMRDLARKPLKNALIIKLDKTGSSFWIISHRKNEKNFLPTSELPTHLAIHEKFVQSGSKNRVVMHAHTNELVALTHIEEFTDAKTLNKVLFGMHPEAIIFIPKGLGFVEYAETGSVEIAEKTLKLIEHHDIVLWEKHGVFAVGEDVLSTFDMIDILTKSAKIYFMCKWAGYEPKGLSEEELKALGKVSVRLRKLVNMEIDY
jgi:rhamnulose-1-phosphate aldolase